MATKPKINTKYAQTKWNMTYAPGRKITHIVDHYTGTKACAENNCKFFSTGNRQASADFFINKDGAIFQLNKNLKNYYSWHCGDGYGRYGVTNANSIGIEVVSAGEQFTAAQKESLKKLHLWLMATYKIPAVNVVRHYDASRKICPKPYCGSASKNKKWKELHAYTTKKTAAKIATGIYKVNVAELVIYSEANAKSKKVGWIKDKGSYTITKTKTAGGESWGYLKSELGWIRLKYCKKS